MKIKNRKVNRILKDRGITLTVLAERMGLDSAQAAFYRVNNAKSLRIIKQVAKALRVKVSEII